ncbi:MAG: hypothetical protein ACT4RN_17275 [Pseudonocardia sp.]
MIDPDVPLLAALDAGLLDPARARTVRAAAAADPAATEVLAALAATRAELAAAPPATVPPAVLARWTAAVSGPAAPGLPYTARPSAPAPPRALVRAALSSSRRRVLVAAAALVVAVVGLLPLTASPAGPGVVRLTGVELAALGTATLGTHDAGELVDPARRAGCLAALVPDAAGSALLGARRVVLDDRSGILLVLGTATLGRFRLVVVGPGCGVLLADTTVGR